MTDATDAQLAGQYEALHGVGCAKAAGAAREGAGCAAECSAPIPLPAMVPAILRLVDGRRTVRKIEATLTSRGSKPKPFGRV